MKKILLIFICIFSIGFVSSFGYMISHLFTPVQQDIVATVCIDPGHGGYDSGAIGNDGTYEKDIALEVSLRIGSMISKMDPSIQIIYTRQSDVISWPENESEDLKARVDISQRADFYISIHCNSNESTDMSGYCFYIKETDTQSRRICQSISDHLKKFHYSSNNGIESTNVQSLYVVDQLDIPSILFEIGYISNDNECKKMQSWLIQNIIAYSTSKAIVDQIHKIYS